MSIIERIYELLKRTEKKPSQLAAYLGVNSGQMSLWKKRNTDPPAKYIASIAEFLGVTTDYLLIGIEKELSADEAPTAYDDQGKPINMPADLIELARLRTNAALTSRIEEVARQIVLEEKKQSD